MTSSSRARQLNRAEVVDLQFLEALDDMRPASGPVDRRGLPDADLLELLDSQMTSRQIDLMARVKRAEN